ncbi:ribose-5-phosphate isomerase [Coriobacterium glomerans PW2]|uniref:Ribose-5-phosphate isomerase n=1 Tax=Coriobacterium glomerans (strain ATCC 49209 / DSM 20642 / JCM 10262 / PW2) TaxID=700015 RepID=F2NAC2_CORGP|nr:ribose 5-phosphate isomerase B [Coriobacterium glomerans]AEB06308.1 ribose-5-phosphate isomerase [Coriobacterium glomerans PW2]
MRVALASDHAGFDQKQALHRYLSEELGCDVVDLGPETAERVDYPDFAEKVARAVASEQAQRGVLLCGTGIGVALAADKVAGIRASSITTPEFAALFRRHNDGNVIGLSGRFIDLEVNEEIVKVFLETDFEGGRHAERVDKIMRIDETGKRGAGSAAGNRRCDA